MRELTKLGAFVSNGMRDWRVEGGRISNMTSRTKTAKALEGETPIREGRRMNASVEDNTGPNHFLSTS